MLGDYGRVEGRFEMRERTAVQVSPVLVTKHIRPPAVVAYSDMDVDPAVEIGGIGLFGLRQISTASPGNAGLYGTTRNWIMMLNPQ